MEFEFDPDDREAILAALDDPDPHNPIAKALSVRIGALTASFADAVKKAGGLPAEITITRPATVLDEIAIELWRESFSENPQAPRIIILDHGRQ